MTNLRDKVVVVTGAAHGIGRAMCERFAVERPRGIVVADIDGEAASRVAEKVGGLPFPCDVRSGPDMLELVAKAESAYGPVDLFCANAGISVAGGPEVSDEAWQDVWEVNVMAHVFASRAVLPSMLSRGEGHLLHTASAAGLLSEISSAPYSMTKHAVVAFAEWLAIAHGDEGLKVSCLCPQGVRTRMLSGDDPVIEMLRSVSISPEEVAECVVQGLRDECFLILPHPEVAEYFQRKASDYDRWLRGMRRLRGRIGAGGGGTDKPT